MAGINLKHAFDWCSWLATFYFVLAIVVATTTTTTSLHTPKNSSQRPLGFEQRAYHLLSSGVMFGSSGVGHVGLVGLDWIQSNQVG